MKKILLIILTVFALSCKQNPNPKEETQKDTKIPFVWEGANIYFLLTDRFKNGDTLNDVNFDRTKATGKLRGFEGGDIKGITQKVKDGYFTDLGINAIWMTPIVEQIHGSTDEGTGNSYAYHGYWAKDWTQIDPNFGTEEDLQELVDEAHSRGIRIILDAVVNHTGPVTEKDLVWPEEWVRTGKTCTYDNYENTISCNLVENLPDIKTESDENVDLPPQLVKKWKAEGRYDQEMAELDAFFERTGHPRAPRFYIMKWLADYITEFGIDGYRVDTVKHTEEYVWQEFKAECDYAFNEFKTKNPDKVLDENKFYLVGEVYNYNISSGQLYDFGDKTVNYFNPSSFHSLINFEFKWNAKQMPQQEMFHKYDSILNTSLKGFGTLNYLTSHDDGNPFDKQREKTFETATKLLLSPGTSQVYYGDESARPLDIKGTEGDATLRSFMNWDDIKNDKQTQDILTHWQKLGQFRAKHPAVGAGNHLLLSQSPFIFKRNFMKDDFSDEVVIGLGLTKGKKIVEVSEVFEDGILLHEAYSSQDIEVIDGEAVMDSQFEIILLEHKN